ncbi:MAG: hypothetical protein JNK45_24615 [Myxococcales bacterium]|nr:hypothetical protein [Myxococcales bacterium]
MNSPLCVRGAASTPIRRAARVVRWAHVICVLCFALIGCRPHGRGGRPDGDDPKQWEARLAARVAKHPEDLDAARDLAMVRWLHLGKTDVALAGLDAAAKAGDPLARLGRLMIADARLESDTTVALAYAIVRDAAKAPDGPERWLHLGAAEIAARRIGGLHGEHPDDDARFIALFDGLDLDRLGTATRQGLLSTRAGIARNANAEYAPYYRRQGCVQEWELGPVEGVQADLELAKDHGPFRRDPTAAAVKLACVVRLWNPTVHAGIRRMRTTLVVPGETLELEVSAEEATRVWLDGELVHRTDRTDRFARSRTVLRVPVAKGEHHLEVATVIPRDRAWVLVRASTPGGALVESRPGFTGTPAARTGSPRLVQSVWLRPGAAIDGPLYAPLRTMLALEDAIHDGDVDEAERQRDALARFEGLAEANFAIGQFERFDPSRGRTVSLAREQAALDRALKRDPRAAAARLRQYELMLERGEHAEVIDALASKDAALPGLRGELLRARAYLQAGDERRCDDAIARAATMSPGNCRVLAMQRGRAREKDDVAREDEVTRALARCGGSLELRAGLAQRRGRFDEAEGLWREALARVPDDLDALESLARLQVAQDDVQGATATLRDVLVRNPLRASAQVVLADIAAASDDIAGARRELGSALERFPHADALHHSAALLGIPDEIESLRVDGLAALAEYRKSGKTYEGVSEVLVLDRSAARVYANGGQRQVVHLVVHLLSKAALDRYGEIEVPQGARLLTLRSIKPDGTLVEAEVVPGKDGIELRDLAIGDVVEHEFLIEREPASALPGYVDVSTFRFRSLDIPYHRTELFVAHPPQMPIREDLRKGAPKPEISALTLGGVALTGRLYRMREVERLGDEPGHRALLDELPNVRVYTELDVPSYLDGLAVQIRAGQRSNVELRRLVRKIVGKRTDAREKLTTLWSWVVENIEDAGDLGAASTATLAARSGSRLMLLRTMLREAGIHAELWLLRDRFGPALIPGGHPMLENYDAAMLAVSLPGAKGGAPAAPTMVLTASKVMPIGYLSSGYAGSDALRVHIDDADGKSGPVTVPAARPDLADRRQWSVEIVVDAEGGAAVEGTITLQGVEALAWRQALREVDRDRIREVFQQAELGWLRGASLRSLDIVDERHLERPLVLKFSATGSQYAIPQGGALMMRGSPLPLSTAARLATLPTRKTGMVVPYAPQLEAKLVVRTAGGALREVPAPIRIDTPFGRYERKLRKGGVGQDVVELELTSKLHAGIVEANDYPAFVEFAAAVETAEQALLKADAK